MATLPVPITALPTASLPLTGNEIIPLVQGGVTKSAPLSNVGYYPATSFERAIAVTPVNYAFPSGNVVRYGADPTGANDSTLAIMTAVAVANATGGGSVIYPAGIFVVGSVSQVSYIYGNIYHLGDSLKTTIISNASSNRPAITVGDGSANLSGGGVYNLAFTGKGGVTGVNGQTGLTVLKVHQFTIENVFITNYLSALYRGISSNLCVQMVIHNLQIQVVTLDGFTNLSATDTYMTDCRSDSNGGSGFVLNFCQGGYYKGCTAYNNAAYAWYLVSTSPSTNPNVNNFFVQCIGDTSGFHNWLISDSVDSYWIGSWASTQQDPAVNTTASGFFITTTNARQLFFTGCTALYNNAHGFELFDPGGSNAPTNIHIVNCQGGSPGVSVSNGNGRAGTGYGLNLTGAVNHIRVSGGSYQNNATGSINLGSSGIDVVVSGNPIGFVTNNEGNGTITIGNSSVVITHGLGFTPASYQIKIWPAASMAVSGVNSLWANNFTSTQFTANVNTNVSSVNLLFAWQGAFHGT